MDAVSENFNWVSKLDCPSSIFTKETEKRLSAKTGFLLWELMPSIVDTVSNVTDVRKHLLHNSLKTGVKATPIEQTRQIKSLEEASNRLEEKSSKFERDCEQLELEIKQQVYKARCSKSKVQTIEAKRNLIKTKANQIKEQTCDCDEMLKICQHLMPSSINVTNDLVFECLDIVAQIDVNNKREVYSSISRILGSVDIHTLWNIILELRSSDSASLIELSSREQSLQTNSNSNFLDIEIAKQSCVHIKSISSCVGNKFLTEDIRRNVVNCIESVEKNFSDISELSNWLVSVLEVKKLNSEKNYTTKLINEMRNLVNERADVILEMNDIPYTMQRLNDRMQECSRDANESLTLLKSARISVTRSNEKLNAALQRVALSPENCLNTSLFDVKLNDELQYFCSTFHIDALAKIMLKEDIKALRYRKLCIREAPLQLEYSSTSSISQFPYTEVPLHFLVECYRQIIISSILSKFQLTEEISMDSDDQELSRSNENLSNIVELLDLTDSVSSRSQGEIDKAWSMLSEWTNQTVKQGMKYIDDQVMSATYEQWTRKYSQIQCALKNDL